MFLQSCRSKYKLLFVKKKKLLVFLLFTMFKIYFYPIKGPLKPNTHFKVNAAHLSLLQPFFFLTLSTPLLLFHSPSSSAPIFSIPISHSLLFSLSLSFSLAFGSHPDTHVRRSWCYIMFFFPTGTHSYATWWSPALPLLPAFPSFFLHTITAVTEATKDSLISQERMVCSKSGVRKSWISITSIIITYTNAMRWKKNPQTWQCGICIRYWIWKGLFLEPSKFLVFILVHKT